MEKVAQFAQSSDSHRMRVELAPFSPSIKDFWYDRYTRSWVVQERDSKGNQIGDAIYVATKKEATDLMK